MTKLWVKPTVEDKVGTPRRQSLWTKLWVKPIVEYKVEEVRGVIPHGNTILHSCIAAAVGRWRNLDVSRKIVSYLLLRTRPKKSLSGTM